MSSLDNKKSYAIPECAKHLHFAQNILFYPLNFHLEEIQEENDIPRIAHMIWVGNDSRPEYFDANANKWKELMPQWEVRIWTNDDLTLEHFPQETLDLLENVKKGAQKADIMRYFIIEKYGGVYVDSDITPHNSLETLITKVPGGKAIICHDLELTWPYVINAFFAAVPNHPLFQIASKLAMIATINTENLHMHTGPRLLGEAVSKLEENKIVLLPIDYFYRNLDYNGRYGNHFYAKKW
jgi:mannosyltransferase OCH1-like enzyme